MGGGTWVVWVHGHRPEAGGAADVAALPGLELAAILDKGVVFRVADTTGAGISLAETLLGGARPLALSGFGLWIDEDRRRLIYVRDGCGEDDATAPFFLDVYPADAADLHGGRQAWGFDAIVFGLQQHGFAEGGRCVAYRDLPDYAAIAIRTGQRPRRGGRADGAETWSVRVPFGTAEPAAALDVEALRGRAAPLVSGAPFEVYRDGGRLVYVREACAAADVGARFFLHVVPADPADLPEDRRANGFANLDFTAREHDYGFEEGGRCIVARTLPDYRIASIRTGQRTRGGAALWDVRAVLARTVAAEAAAALDVEALRGRAAPLGTGAPFEVYRDGRRLVYVREDCAAGDAVAPFFLHVVPRDPAVLPEERRESGFDNLDFAFGEAGALEDGRCVAVRDLPAYGIASIRTGQWTGGEGQLWRVEAAFAE